MNTATAFLEACNELYITLKENAIPTAWRGARAGSSCESAVCACLVCVCVLSACTHCFPFTRALCSFGLVFRTNHLKKPPAPMAGSDLRTVRFINTQLLGRRRPTVELVSEDEHDLQEDPAIAMNSLSTETTADREEVLFDCAELYEALADVEPTLFKHAHRSYLDYALGHPLPPQMKALDASQPWLLYWTACALRLMDPQWLTQDVQRKMVHKLALCALDSGPYCGGFGQQAHLVCNYAAINALALCDNIDGCWASIKREGIYEWLLTLKMPGGGFRTGALLGECDSRSTYCALSVASMLGVLTPELCEGVEAFLLRCQTYEGGFGACPHEDEAHGGYTFCAAAGLAILGSLRKCDTAKLLDWCSARQTNEEKGLSGRSNKLVDGCYSYWVGAVAAILEAYGLGESIDKSQLREYILKCCQSKERPGLRDKPGKSPDYYHTAYVLMGLSATEYSFSVRDCPQRIQSARLVEQPDVEPVNPIFGLPIDVLARFVDYNAAR
ncbi:protein farnesyltransferase [Lachancea thermotolerans CBS 6340]|uniref:Protein farnesyltransferase subunit beta n=1 Tax=Lachancea thermotolerans (strain ATCC 56472 / CBS 6340 / NRRL Y-8284) TaxID=559295 RepID=C5DL64_LACTC|nr:KLTH0F10340p [Lachancea thermotolerans CBS 6340]CAR24215.1 KLTH0F10340p [Lachancea thermotolerans CBS 6340]